MNNPASTVAEVHGEGLEVEDPDRELDPWGEDPVTQLPEVIEPGHIGMTLWSNNPDGTPAAWDVAFTWHGGCVAEWYYDISPAGGDLSPASSSPITGTAGWPNGRDAHVAYLWRESEVEGAGNLLGAAPVADEGFDDDASDPEGWVRLGQAIVAFLYEELY